LSAYSPTAIHTNTTNALVFSVRVGTQPKIKAQACIMLVSMMSTAAINAMKKNVKTTGQSVNVISATLLFMQIPSKNVRPVSFQVDTRVACGLIQEHVTVTGVSMVLSLLVSSASYVLMLILPITS